MQEVLDTVENSSNIVLYALDETSIRNESNNYSSWSTKGVSPAIERNGSHKGINVIGATEISKTFECFMECYDKTISIDSSKVITFLENLLTNNVGKTVMVILDNAKNHKSKAIREFVASNKDQLELIYLPPYSPELNPQENIWNKVKRALFKLRARMNIEELFCNLSELVDNLNYYNDQTKSTVYGRNYYY